MSNNIRWVQRFSNFQKALRKLEAGLENEPEQLNDLEKEGVIQRFEYTHELAWNTLKDLLIYQGASEALIGSRDATREAFTAGLIEQGDTWMEMIKSRNLTSHTYHEDTASEIFQQIRTHYFPCFLALEQKLLARLKAD